MSNYKADTTRNLRHSVVQEYMAALLVNRIRLAFEGSLVESHREDCEDVLYCRWKRVLAIYSVQYDLQGDTKRLDFVDMLSDKVWLFGRGVKKSERSVLLQQDAIVKSGADIRINFYIDV